MQIYVVAGVAYWWQSGTEAMLAKRSFKNYVDPNYPTLTPHPLEWPNMDIFNILSTLCYVTLRGLPTDPPPPFFCPRSYWMTPKDAASSAAIWRAFMYMHSGEKYLTPPKGQ